MFLVKTRVSPVILIEIDESQRFYHRLNRRLSRIGSDPRSNLFLPESIAERHMAVLEWENGVVRIHNRSGYKFRLGETGIAPGTSAEWPDRRRLSINDRVSMVLALNPGNAASSLQGPEDAIRLDEESRPADSASSTNLSLAAILFGLLAIAASMGAENERDIIAAALEPLVIASDEPGPNRAVRREIVARLQTARRQEFRTGKMDKQTWAELRDFVKSLESESGRLPDRWFEDLRDLVLRRLASES